MSISHPKHFALTNPAARDLYKLAKDPRFAAQLIERQGGKPGYDLHMNRTRAVMSVCLDQLDPLMADGTIPESKPPQWMKSIGHDYQVYTLFCGAGRIIFDLSPELSSAFNRSELGDARVSDLRLPFESFYLKFNLVTPINLPNGRPFDGAYIFTGKDNAFTGMMLVSGEGQAFPDMEDIGLHASFENYPANMTLASALEAGYQTSIKSWSQASVEAAAQYGCAPDQVSNPQLDFFISSHAIIRQIVHLIGNALLFLSIYPEEVESQWEREAPAELVAKASSNKPKERRQVYDQLWELGFSKIRYCRFKQPPRNPERSGESATGHKVAQHWRRGHWRNQPHGKNNSLRKLLWLRPCLIGTAPASTKGKEFIVTGGDCA